MVLLAILTTRLAHQAAPAPVVVFLLPLEKQTWLSVVTRVVQSELYVQLSLPGARVF